MIEPISPVQKAGLFIQENVALAPLTTLQVGGAARFFVSAQTEKDLIETVRWTEIHKIPLFVLGGGSNVLFSDEGFKGIVLKIGLKGIELAENETGIEVTAQAGESWDDFVRFCVEKKLAGVECLSGIPGTVGGTPVQNVGAYGQEVSETIRSVRVLHRKTGEISEMSGDQCEFSYRESIFNTSRKNEFIVLAVSFLLIPNGAPKIVYKDLLERFGNSQPSLADVRSAVLEIRRAKSMVTDKSDPNAKSAGSFFKNPLVTNEKLKEIASNTGFDNIPIFKIDAKMVKIPAAWLIEKSGFPKGYMLGKAGISTKHTLAIVNFQNARARDIVALKDEIQARVKEKFGLELQPEPIFVGF